MHIYFDGSSKGNPGKGTSGWVILCTATRIGWAMHRHCTNNESEYIGLIEALKCVVDGDRPTSLTILGDSDLIIKQMTGIYNVRHPRLVELHTKAVGLVNNLRQGGCNNITFTHVGRRNNVLADYLTNIPYTLNAPPRRFDCVIVNKRITTTKKLESVIKTALNTQF